MSSKAVVFISGHSRRSRFFCFEYLVEGRKGFLGVCEGLRVSAGTVRALCRYSIGQFVPRSEPRRTLTSPDYTGHRPRTTQTENQRRALRDTRKSREAGRTPDLTRERHLSQRPQLSAMGVFKF